MARGIVVVVAELLLRGSQFGDGRVASVGVEELLSQNGQHGGIASENHRAAVTGCDFYGSVESRSGCPADEQRNLQPFFLHEASHVTHFVERRSDETA